MKRKNNEKKKTLELRNIVYILKIPHKVKAKKKIKFVDKFQSDDSELKIFWN